MSPTEEPRGTTRDYITRRLKRDNPDLAQRVIRGELSARAVAIEAGIIRPPTPVTSSS